MSSPSEMAVTSTLSANNSLADEPFDVDTYLAGTLGPKQQYSETLRILLSLLFVLIMITGTCGNVLTCFVIIRNRVMHTTTNIYILNLAIADLTTLISGLPIEIFFLWQQYPWPFGYPVCVMRTSLIEFAAYNSVMTITAFTTERYMAVCHPLKSATFKSRKSAFRTVAAIWAISVVFCVPYALSAEVFAYLTFPNIDGSVDIPQSIVCSIPAKHAEKMRIVIQVSAYLFFVFPLIYVAVLYAMIGMRIRQSATGNLLNRGHSITLPCIGEQIQKLFSISTCFRKQPNPSDSQKPKPLPLLAPEISSKFAARYRQNNSSAKNASAPLYLTAVVIAFFICWCPFHLQRLLSIYLASKINAYQAFFNFLYNTSGVLFYISPTINPLLYSLLSSKFRRAFKHSFCCFEHDKQFSNFSSFSVKRAATLPKTTNEVSQSIQIELLKRINTDPSVNIYNKETSKDYSTQASTGGVNNCNKMTLRSLEYKIILPDQSELSNELKTKSPINCNSSCGYLAGENPETHDATPTSIGEISEIDEDNNAEERIRQLTPNITYKILYAYDKRLSEINQKLTPNRQELNSPGKAPLASMDYFPSEG